MVITKTQRAEVETELAEAGILDGDQATSIATLLKLAPSSTYADWRRSLAEQPADETDVERDARLAATYGHDAARAACVLSQGIAS